jgi:hypothetical protein
MGRNHCNWNSPEIEIRAGISICCKSERRLDELSS